MATNRCGVGTATLHAAGASMGMPTSQAAGACFMTAARLQHPKVYTDTQSFISASPVKAEILYPLAGGSLCLDKSVTVPRHGREA